MELDLNKFRTLIPICTLFEESLLYLADFSRRERYPAGGVTLESPPGQPESIYLMSGEIILARPDAPDLSLSAGSNRTLYPISSDQSASTHFEVTSSSATFVRVDSHLLNKLLAWGESASEALAAEALELAKTPSAEESEWMISMLSTAIFTQLPAANIQKLFTRMQKIKVNKGNVIVRTGEPGDYFYFIREGRCKVTLPSVSGETTLAELGPRCSFGEAALICDAPRNANITMLTPGVLMRLSKDDFTQLMEEPVMKWVDKEETTTLLNRGAVLIDVRFRREFERGALPNAQNISMNKLRAAIPRLNKSLTYILYCNTGERSAVAAFLMIQHGFNVFVLKDNFTGND